MNADLNMDVIRSALLTGEIDDAFRVIWNAISRIQYLKSVNNTDKYDLYLAFLNRLLEIIKGQKKPSSIDDFIKQNPDLSKMIDPSFLVGFPYFLAYTMDRYDVRFPYFDGKRCDDR
ncbi:MAG: hypothetical protein ACP5UV_00760 [Thermoplasmata archaeon]